MLANENEDIGKVVEKLKYVSSDDKERFRIDQIEKGRMDYYSGMKSNYTKGKAEGREEGERIGAKNKSINMAKELLDDFDNERISQITGLTIEEINLIREKNLS